MVGVECGNHLVEEIGTGMDAMHGVDPKHGALFYILEVDSEPGCAVVAAAEYGGSEHLGIMVGVTGFAACDVGEGMLPKHGLPVDGDNRPGIQVAEIGLACDDKVLPRVGIVVCFTVMENFHCCIDFRFVDEFRGKDSAHECQKLAPVR